jgi:hypothetical protein
MSSIRQGSIVSICSNCCCAAGKSESKLWLVALNGELRVLLAVQVVEYVSPEAHYP